MQESTTLRPVLLGLQAILLENAIYLDYTHTMIAIFIFFPLYFLSLYNYFNRAMCPEVDSVSESEYQGFILG